MKILFFTHEFVLTAEINAVDISNTILFLIYSSVFENTQQLLLGDCAVSNNHVLAL